jgi:protein-serine/threonine kinase
MPKLSPSNINHLHDSIIIKFLGKGGFGNVKLYQCREKIKDKNGQIIECSKCFVVKQLYNKSFKNFFGLIKNPKEYKLKKILLNEYTIGTLLHHPNIRETIDIDLIYNCIIFEYCDGIDLYDYIIENKYNTFCRIEFIFYFRQIINAVQYMHNMGIAHRDLKLENIMINTNTKILKLIDLGEACVCSINGYKINSFGIHGTKSYIAPEQFSLKQSYDALKVDIWSIGIILYELIYLKMPWNVANNTDLRYIKYRDSYKTIKSIPIYFPNVNTESTLHKLFIMMLNPNPKLRNTIDYINEILNNNENIFS